MTINADSAFAEAARLDAQPDPANRRDEFAIPLGSDGAPTAYFAGNSLGLQPTRVITAVHEALDSWGRLGVAGHTTGAHPWMPYHAELRDTVARLVGARSGEAVIMNSLTVNLHMMMSTFYRPTPERYRIVVEYDAFPSDRYAVDSQAVLHGFDPTDAIIAVRPRPGSDGISPDDLATVLADVGDTVALVLLGGINFRTGALLDVPAITALTHQAGAIAGWDFAHAAGNVPLSLHDWDVDFAIWCTYKYLNAGPGALGGCFVHERNSSDPSLPRPSGWWGQDPESRFAMPTAFTAQPGAEGWQVSNPPIMSMAAVRASLEMFDEIGMDAIRARSLKLTGFLETLLDEASANAPFTIVTPRDPARRGAQLSIEVDAAADVTERLAAHHGVVADDRPPNIIRLAPTPLYTSFHDCVRAVVALEGELS
jgi:kynureninase